MQLILYSAVAQNLKFSSSCVYHTEKENFKVILRQERKDTGIILKLY